VEKEDGYWSHCRDNRDGGRDHRGNLVGDEVVDAEDANYQTEQENCGLRVDEKSLHNEASVLEFILISYVIGGFGFERPEATAFIPWFATFSICTGIEKDFVS
jgi:hypothetical protein